MGRSSDMGTFTTTPRTDGLVEVVQPLLEGRALQEVVNLLQQLLQQEADRNVVVSLRRYVRSNVVSAGGMMVFTMIHEDGRQSNHLYYAPRDSESEVLLYLIQDSGGLFRGIFDGPQRYFVHARDAWQKHQQHARRIPLASSIVCGGDEPDWSGREVDD